MRIIQKLTGTVVLCGLVFLPLYLLVWGFIVTVRWTDFRGSHLVSRSRYATTQGKVLSSRIVGRGRGCNYCIEYEFAVQGVRYCSQQVSFGSRGGYGYAVEYVAKYPPGKSVTVFYDRVHPDFVVLEPDVRTDFLTSLWIPLVLFGLCFLALLLLPEADAGCEPASEGHPPQSSRAQVAKEIELLEHRIKMLKAARSRDKK